MNPTQRAWADRCFFGGMGIAMAITVFLGFERSFFLRDAQAPPLPAFLHWHGIVASAWMLLFIVQTALIAARRPRVHRLLGFALAAFAIVLSSQLLIVAITSRGLTSRAVFGIGAALMFAGYVTAGVVQRRNPEAHKRWMLLATITLLPPAIARLDLSFIPHDSFGPNFASLFFLVPAFAFDFATRRRLNPALGYGALVMILLLPVRLWIKTLLP
jgi:hypothetical protein